MEDVEVRLTRTEERWKQLGERIDALSDVLGQKIAAQSDLIRQEIHISQAQILQQTQVLSTLHDQSLERQGRFEVNQADQGKRLARMEESRYSWDEAVEATAKIQRSFVNRDDVAELGTQVSSLKTMVTRLEARIDGMESMGSQIRSLENKMDLLQETETKRAAKIDLVVKVAYWLGPVNVVMIGAAALAIFRGG